MAQRKILMALMGLEIGGAETHVVELSKELRRMGYDIAVVSNGGVYVAELEEAGICVYTAAASSVSLEAVPEGTSFRLEEGAAFLIYLPGADVQSLPEAFSGFDGQDTLPCWGVYFPAEEMAFTCSQP